jgi:hypothetical protein
MKVRIKSLPKADTGLQIEGNQFEMLSPNTILLKGKSHEKGGTKVRYGNNVIEAEAGETMHIQPQRGGDQSIVPFLTQSDNGITMDNSAIVGGNMLVPGTNQKFKTAFKDIAKIENKAFKNQTKATDYINTNSPYNPYQALSFNTGKVLQDAANQQNNLAYLQKDTLTTTQNAMLSTADKFGMEPQELSKKMKKGGTLRVKVDPPSQEFMYAAGGQLSAEKAREILHDGTVHGQPLTPKQRRYFGWVAGGGSKAEMGMNMVPEGLNYFGMAEDGLDTRYQGFLNLLKQEGIPYKVSSALRKPDGDFSWHQKGKAVDLQPGNNTSFEDFNKSIMNNPKVMEYISNNDLGYLNEAPSIGGVKTKHWTGEHLHFGDDSKLKFSNSLKLQNAYKKATGKEYINQMPEVVISGNKKYTTNEMPSLGFSPMQELSIPGNEFTPKEATQGQLNRGIAEQTAYNKAMQPVKKTSLADQMGFNPLSVLPELVTLTERPDYVPHFSYQPNLYTPYQVSFQDKLNENNSTFRALTQQLPNNPEALSVLGAQKYNADSQVLADQFRTNQAIQEDVTNKNVGLLNSAMLQNLQFAGIQQDTMAKNKAVTKSRKYAAANSIVDKVQQAKQQQNQVRMMENMFGYRYNPSTSQFVNQNDPHYFDSRLVTGQSSKSPEMSKTQTKQVYGPDNKLMRTEVINKPEEEAKYGAKIALKKTMAKWGNSMK